MLFNRNVVRVLSSGYRIDEELNYNAFSSN